MNLFENLQIMRESEEVKTFNISFELNNVPQTNLIKAYDEEQAKEYFANYKPNAKIYGINVATNDDMKPGKPVIDATKEASIIKDEKDMEQVVENTTLRPFDSRDRAGWGGVHNFADDSEPMIVDGEFATILVGQSDEQVGTESACISIYYGDPEADAPQWGFKTYDDKDSAIKDAKFLARLADDEVDENQLKRFGFEIVG